MNRKDFDLIAKRYGPSAKVPPVGIRLHHDRQLLSVANDGHMRMGYRYLAIEIGSRYLGGVVFGGCRTRLS